MMITKDDFPFKLAAAPLAGFSNRAFRDVCRTMGADIAYGEMISSRGISYANKRTLELMDVQGEAAPVIVQLSGSDPEAMAEAAIYAASQNVDIIDLNMGCPVGKIVRNHEGSALMQNLPLAAKLIKSAKTAGKPVSIKFRSGWDDEHINAVDFAIMAEEAGAAFVAIHARTRQQFYNGKADISLIAQVKAALNIPVIGNGDIYSAMDALRMLEQTGCDGIMPGRGMIGNPWLFRELRAALSGEEIPARPLPEEVLSTALAHLEEHIRRSIFWYEQREGASADTHQLAEDLAVRSMRAHLGWYTKGLRYAAKLRLGVNQLHTATAIRELFQDYLASLGK